MTMNLDNGWNVYDSDAEIITEEALHWLKAMALTFGTGKERTRQPATTYSTEHEIRNLRLFAQFVTVRWHWLSSVDGSQYDGSDHSNKAVVVLREQGHCWVQTRRLNVGPTARDCCRHHFAICAILRLVNTRVSVDKEHSQHQMFPLRE
ncbi:hypothetical protein SNOG_02445 [Parastagonospora nodorum SN15]|uniref:Uncharacterized protein n=1 Tax=Phaeosphaeria nodorum (strain SN15 / ATCC MYA-4574 / FGSC 10173) TaxID=321614 RepID=Q0V0L9_PHANO|nr:hypothetical protein SNOG_02445 [Parastagonospora nodorum SN15]EAT90657.1 hypothetical protein SNOG_02445 [Parastagonospora nodorum SN15]